jgi:general secretion pathway protein N
MINVNRFSRRWVLLSALGLILAILVFMPLRFAVGMAVPPASAITAKSVYGGIWAGGINDLNAGPLSFGSLRVRLGILPLLTGRAEYLLSPLDGAVDPGFNGTIGTGWGGVQIEHLTGAANHAQDAGPLPLSGAEFQDFSVRFAGGTCRSASGSIRLLLKPAAIPGINAEGGFLGNAKCREGKLFLPLISGSAMERIDLSIDANGKYSFALTLNNVEPQTAAMLSLNGFRPISGGYTQAFNGQF